MWCMCSGCSVSQVEDWKGNVRTVNFTMPMSIPPVVAKLIRESRIRAYASEVHMPLLEPCVTCC